MQLFCHVANKVLLLASTFKLEMYRYDFYQYTDNRYANIYKNQ